MVRHFASKTRSPGTCKMAYWMVEHFASKFVMPGSSECSSHNYSQGPFDTYTLPIRRARRHISVCAKMDVLGQARLAVSVAQTIVGPRFARFGLALQVVELCGCSSVVRPPGVVQSRALEPVTGRPLHAHTARSQIVLSKWL